MSILMGPVLSFRGSDGAKWNVSVLIVVDGEPERVKYRNRNIDHEVLWQTSSGTVYRYILALPMGNREACLSYKVGQTSYDIVVPASTQAPTMAYASCNGFSSLKLMKGVRDKNAVWKVMARRHGLTDVVHEDGMPETTPAHPYHLLLQGGDQVYADAMWETVPAMKDWNALDWAEGNAVPMTAAMQQQLDKFFFELYVSRWSQPEVARMIARVPSIAMWDDHDLIDGWGSYPPERQDCPVFKGIWIAASKAFAVFQQHLADGERRPGSIGQAGPGWWKQAATQETRAGAFSCGYVVANVAILAIDMRSQRTDKSRVVSKEHWSELFGWLDQHQDVAHVMVMSSIPVVYPGFDTIEKVLGIFPGHQDLEDDLRDHWRSQPHQGERLRLIHQLLALSKRRKTRVTILSGDVHIAALGIIESKREQAAGSENVVNQLISSAVVHPGPGGVVLFALRYLFDSDEEIDRGVFGRMMTFPNSKTKFLGGRNYLSLEPDDSDRFWCNWFVERQDYPFTKVIHPLGKDESDTTPDGTV